MSQEPTVGNKVVSQERYMMPKATCGTKPSVENIMGQNHLWAKPSFGNKVPGPICTFCPKPPVGHEPPKDPKTHLNHK